MSKAIKEKMDKLDTLSGGIVFGKEEAWERLQAKLDKKPARRIPLVYKLSVAAAAVLLLRVCITALYDKTEEKIAAAPALYQNEPAQPAPTTPAVKENAAGVVASRAKEIHTAKHTERIPAPAAIIEATASTPEPETPAPEVAATDLPSKIPVTMVATAPKPKMRVVHINELDNEAPREMRTYTTNQPKVRDMKVVSANEETRDQAEAIIHRYNKPHGTLPFFTLPGGNSTATNESQPLASNPFNIKLSIQN